MQIFTDSKFFWAFCSRFTIDLFSVHNFAPKNFESVKSCMRKKSCVNFRWWKFWFPLCICIILSFPVYLLASLCMFLLSSVFKFLKVEKDLFVFVRSPSLQVPEVLCSMLKWICQQIVKDLEIAWVFISLLRRRSAYHFDQSTTLTSQFSTWQMRCSFQGGSATFMLPTNFWK